MSRWNWDRVGGPRAARAAGYLMAYAACALVFRAAVASGGRAAGEELAGARAALAAESGLSFLKYALSRVSVGPGTADGDVLAAVYQDLRAQLDGTANLTGARLALGDGAITIPAGADEFIDLGPGGRFRATIRSAGGRLSVAVAGRDRGDEVMRTVAAAYVKRGHRTRLFDYAVASRGQVVINQEAVAHADGPSRAGVCSTLHTNATSSILLSEGQVGGGLFVTGSKEDVAVSAGTVNGSSAAAAIKAEHTHLVEAPDFPAVDTAPFRRFATNTWEDGYAGDLENLLIPAGRNPRFGGGKQKVTLKGVIYVQSPNTVTFRGDVTVEGVIVFESAGDSAVNVLDFGGSVTQGPAPTDERFGELRAAAAGYAILAPTAAVSVTVSADSTFEGSLLVGRFALAGGADVRVNNGSLVTYDAAAGACTLNGKRLIFSGAAGGGPATGLTYSSFFMPVAAGN